MDGVVVRPARVSEQTTLEALQLRASLTNDGDREAILAHPDAIAAPLEQIAAGQVFVAEGKGVVAGFGAVLPREDGQTELDALFVDPDFRRRGIARLLVEHCAGVARRHRSTALHVVGNPHAEEFYLACGFVMIGRSETRFGVGLLFKKAL
jgi:GNAT superfamily N-acetyltransferase